MIIGTFRYDEATDSFHGDIITLGFDYFEIMITPAEKHSAREPDYRVTAPTSQGRAELGAAWKRLSEHGREYVSVMLDGPMLTAPISAVLFTDEEGSATLRWTRSKAAGKGREVAAVA